MNPLTSRLAPPGVPPRDGSAAVHRGDLMAGWRVDYTHGSIREPVTPLPTPPRSTVFQPFLTWLWALRFNDFLFRSGQRSLSQTNDGRTFKVATIDPAARVAGTTGKMNPKPAFTRVQQVKRYSTAPKAYNTTPGKP